MTNQSHGTGKFNSEPLPKKTPKVYQPPTLTLLDESEPEGGSANVPETNNGLLES